MRIRSPRQLRIFGVIPALCLAAATASCSETIHDEWIETEAHLVATVHDGTAPVAGARVRLEVHDGDCSGAVPSTVNVFTTDPAGRVESVVRSLPVGSFDGCVDGTVTAPGYRDSTIPATPARFRDPDGPLPMDTIRLAVVLARN